MGLLIGAGLELKEGVNLAAQRDGGWRTDVELGGTWAVGFDGNELMALARAGFRGPVVDTSLIAGYRGYFGKDRLKTFFDLGGALHFTPSIVVGPRVGFGLQFELSSIIGVYLAAAAQLGAGDGLRFDAELTTGLQFRSYLLE